MWSPGSLVLGAEPVDGSLRELHLLTQSHRSRVWTSLFGQMYASVFDPGPSCDSVVRDPTQKSGVDALGKIFVFQQFSQFGGVQAYGGKQGEKDPFHKCSLNILGVGRVKTRAESYPLTREGEVLPSLGIFTTQRSSRPPPEGQNYGGHSKGQRSKRKMGRFSGPQRAQRSQRFLLGGLRPVRTSVSRSGGCSGF